MNWNPRVLFILVNRKSSQIIDHQIKTLKDPLSGCKKYMACLKKDAFEMRDILVQGN